MTLSPIYPPSTRIWFPTLVVNNAADPDYVMIERTDTVSLTSDGVITYSTSAFLKTTCDMDVTYYPFDFQVFTVTVVVIVVIIWVITSVACRGEWGCDVP